MDRKAEPTTPIIEDLEADAIAPVEPVAPIAEPLAFEQMPAFGDALDAGLTRRNGAQSDQKTALRRQYDAFVEQHGEALTWKGLAQVGTIVAIEGEHAIMHVGRHHFMRFDIGHDLHGAIPKIGVSISVGPDGSIEATRPEHERTRERGRER